MKHEAEDEGGEAVKPKRIEAGTRISGPLGGLGLGRGLGAQAYQKIPGWSCATCAK